MGGLAELGMGPNPITTAYDRQVALNNQQGVNQLQQATGLVTLAQHMQAAQRDAAFRNDLQALGPDATPEQRMGVAVKYAAPKDVVDTANASIMRKDALEQTRQIALARLTQTAATAQQSFMFKMRSATSQEARDAATQEYRAAQQDIARQGLALTGARVGMEGARTNYDLGTNFPTTPPPVSAPPPAGQPPMGMPPQSASSPFRLPPGLQSQPTLEGTPITNPSEALAANAVMDAGAHGQPLTVNLPPGSQPFQAPPAAYPLPRTAPPQAQAPFQGTGGSPSASTIPSMPPEIARLPKRQQDAWVMAQAKQNADVTSPVADLPQDQLRSMSWDDFAKRTKAGLSGAALQLNSLQLGLTGVMPQMGMGGQGRSAQVRVATMEGRAKVAAELGVTPEQMIAMPPAWKSDAGALVKLTARSEQIQSIMSSFHNNVSTFESVAEGRPPQLAPDRIAALGSDFQKIDFTNVKAINDAKLAIKRQFNDPGTVAYVTAAMTVAMDYARILSSQGLSAAQVSDSARQEGMKLIAVGYNKPARQALIGTLESDTLGQVKGLTDQVAQVKTRMASMGTPQGTARDTGAVTMPEFATEAAAAAANIPRGTRVKVGGVVGTWH